MSELQVTPTELDLIFDDESWNCRGHIAPIDVLDLIRDIEKNKLQNPVIIQPYKNDLKPNKLFKLVAGYRRFTAYKTLRDRENKAGNTNNEWNKIPAIIRPDLTELDARRINLQENLIRKQLNILQEAKALAPFQKAGWTEKEIADEFVQSTTWVRVRLQLLVMNPDIQADAAAGLLTQENIKQLYSLPESKRNDAVKEIKERKLRGEKRVVLKEAKPKRNPYKRKPPDKDDIITMTETIAKVIGMGFHTRLLAWAGGNISDLELLKDFEDYCKENGYDYEVPEDLRKSYYQSA